MIDIPKILVCTIDSQGNEVWTNPPTKKIDEVWEFIEHMFGKKYIKSFRFIDGKKVYLNPKEKKVEFIQLELF